MKKVLVSACLVGERTRYDGGSKRLGHPVLARWEAEGRLVLACPEVLGGLPVPRPPAELVGPGEVRDVAGVDRTPEFSRGAQAALALARQHDVACAVLKERSPSCGTHQVHDGRFGGGLVAGEGLTTRALRAAGVAVFSEDELEAAAACLAAAER